MKASRKSSSVASKDEKDGGISEKSPPITRGRPAKIQKSLGPDFLDPLELGPTYASKRGVHQVTDLKTSSPAVPVVTSNSSASKKSLVKCSECRIEFTAQADLNGDSRSTDQEFTCKMCSDSFREPSSSSKRQRKVNNKSTPNSKASTAATSTSLRPINVINTSPSVTAAATSSTATTKAPVSSTASSSASTLTCTSSSSSSLSTIDLNSQISGSSNEMDSSVPDTNETIMSSSQTLSESSENASQKAAAGAPSSDMDYEESDVTTVNNAETIVSGDEPVALQDAIHEKSENNEEVKMQIDESISPNDSDAVVKRGESEEKITCDEEQEKMEEEQSSTAEKETQMVEENSSASFEATNESAQIMPGESTLSEKESNATSEVSQAGDMETSVESKTQVSNESTQVTVTHVEASAASLKSNSSSAESTSSISDEAKANYRFRSPDTWSVDEVEQFITSTGFPRESQTFKEEEIDGKSLLLLKRDDVLTGLGFKLGPALKIYSFIHHLQNFNLLTVLATPPGSVTAESTVDNESNNVSTHVNCNTTVNSNSPSTSAECAVSACKDTMDSTDQAADAVASSSSSPQVKRDVTLNQIVTVGEVDGQTPCTSKNDKNDSHMPSSGQVDNSLIENDSHLSPAETIEPIEATVDA